MTSYPDEHHAIVLLGSRYSDGTKRELDRFNKSQGSLSCYHLWKDEVAKVEAQLLVFLLCCAGNLSLSEEETSIVEQVRARLQEKHPRSYECLLKLQILFLEGPNPASVEPS